MRKSLEKNIENPESEHTIWTHQKGLFLTEEKEIELAFANITTASTRTPNRANARSGAREAER